MVQSQIILFYIICGTLINNYYRVSHYIIFFKNIRNTFYNLNFKLLQLIKQLMSSLLLTPIYHKTNN